MRLMSDTGEAPTAASDSPLDAALDAALALPHPGTAAAAAPTTATTPPSSSSQMSVNLDSRVLPTGKQAADAQDSSSSGSSKGTAATNASRGSSATTGVRSSSSSGGGGSAAAGALDWQAGGSITLQQVAGEAGKLGLQLLEVLVRVAVFVVKYTLKAFIWLVKLIAQYVSNTN